MNKWLKAMLIACVSVLFPVNNLYSQERWEDIFERLVASGDEDSSQWENLMEELTDLKEHPVNINTATKEQRHFFNFIFFRLSLLQDFTIKKHRCGIKLINICLKRYYSYGASA